jgi:hypothetical protein
MRLRGVKRLMADRIEKILERWNRNAFASSALLLLALFLLSSSAWAQSSSCGQQQCQGIFWLLLNGNREAQCVQMCTNEYVGCSNGGPTPGSLLCNLDSCMAEFSACVCACPIDIPQPGGGPRGGCPQCGDPVDTGSGLFLYQQTDLRLRDVVPIEFGHVYRELDTTSRAFGIGMATNYDMGHLS